MKILVTGGAGFIGSHVVDAYLREGHEVIVVDNLSTGKKENINPSARFYEIDICDPAIEDIFSFEKPDILNHHAACADARISVRNPIEDLRINVAGLINVVSKGLNVGLKKVIFASSGGAIYGDQVKYPATEADDPQPINPYGLNKLICEQYLAYYERVYRLPSVALRYANVYGPRQGGTAEAGVVAAFIKAMLSNKQPVIYGDGCQTRDFVYVADAVDANVLSLKQEVKGVFNVSSGVETDVNALFRALRELTESRFMEKHVPPQEGDQPRSLLSSGYIYEKFGWKAQTALELGLRHTVEWFEAREDCK